MKLIALFISLTFFFSCYSQTRNKYSKELKGLDAELEEVRKDWNVAGFSVAIVDQDGLIYSKGFGFRDFEKKLKATENTLYAIGSCSKSFTSALVGVLEQRGDLSLSDHPSKHITGLTFFNNELNSGVQITDLMRHSTGLPRHDYSWYMFNTDDRDSLMRRLEYLEPFAGIRERWYYNNFMFLLQGMIVESVTDSTWEQNIEAKFFDRLEMSTANTSIMEMETAEEPSLGYVLNKNNEIEKTDYYRIRGMAPAGSINASVKEMSNWVNAWINGGKFKNEEVIPAAFVQQAISSQMVVTGGLPSSEHPDLHLANYGFGWFLSSYKGHLRVEHGGNIDGFSANTSFFPSDSLGIVVLVNQGGSSVPSVVRNLIADRLLNLKKSDWSSELLKGRDQALSAQKTADSTKYQNKVTGTRPSHSQIEYTGTYHNPGYGEFAVTLANDSLFMKAPTLDFWVRHYHYDIFDAVLIDENNGIDTTITAGPPLSFQTGTDGAISGLEVQLEPSLDPLFFKRTPTLLDLSAEELEKFVGEYELMGVVTKVYVKNENTLYLFVPGQPEYELLPIEKNLFSIKILDGFKVRFEEEEGKVIALYSVQPNGTFKATRIEGDN